MKKILIFPGAFACLDEIVIYRGCLQANKLFSVLPVKKDQGGMSLCGQEKRPRRWESRLCTEKALKLVVGSINPGILLNSVTAYLLP